MIKSFALSTVTVICLASAAQAGEHRHHERQEMSETEIAASAYKTLGPLPDGAQIESHTVISLKDSFTCPDGSAAELVNTGKSDGYTHRRWHCN